MEEFIAGNPQKNVFVEGSATSVSSASCTPMSDSQKEQCDLIEHAHVDGVSRYSAS